MPWDLNKTEFFTYPLSTKILFIFLVSRPYTMVKQMSFSLKMYI
jgi:hypothetical protein